MTSRMAFAIYKGMLVGAFVGLALCYLFLFFKWLLGE